MSRKNAKKRLNNKDNKDPLVLQPEDADGVVSNEVPAAGAAEVNEVKEATKSSLAAGNLQSLGSASQSWQSSLNMVQQTSTSFNMAEYMEAYNRKMDICKSRLNEAMDDFKNKGKALEDLIKPKLELGDVQYIQECYIALCDLQEKIDERFAKAPGVLLEKTRAERWALHKATWEVLAKVRTALVKFKHSLPDDQAAIMTDQAPTILEFLKGGVYERLELKKIQAKEAATVAEEENEVKEAMTAANLNKEDASANVVILQEVTHVCTDVNIEVPAGTDEVIKNEALKIAVI